MTLKKVNTPKQTEYVYTDEHKNVMHKTVRIDHSDKPKKIWQEPKDNKVWYPYNLPTALDEKTTTLCYVEGEKTADSMNAVLDSGCVATTKPQGSSRPEMWSDFFKRYPQLTKKEHVIFPDNDETGKKYARGVARAILKECSYATVKIVELPNLPPKGDFVEYRESFENDKACSDALYNAIYDAKELEPADVAEPIQNVPSSQWQSFPIDRLPSTLRNMVVGVQNTIGLKDSSTPAIATLATVSGLIGASSKIRLKQGYLQPAHIYTAIIGKSGQAKSGTKEYILEGLQCQQSEWFEEWERENENYERDMKEWKAAKKGERSACPIEPEPPKRIIVSDTTIEAVGQRLKENPFGLLLYNDELETYIGNLERYTALFTEFFHSFSFACLKKASISFGSLLMTWACSIALAANSDAVFGTKFAIKTCFI